MIVLGPLLFVASHTCGFNCLELDRLEELLDMESSEGIVAKIIGSLPPTSPDVSGNEPSQRGAL